QKKSLPQKKPVLEPSLFPINPGQQNLLAGSMGELRDSHFHAGLDIRTDNQAGALVRATQRGYVSRVIVSAFGYGQVLFVTHPDSNVSVYAHLDRFKGKLAEYVLKKQYEQKSFNLNLELSPDQFPVNRGDTIAFSGNTGASAGPHLHFEIRNGKNEALNPLTFGFTEIKDRVAPIVQKVAIKPLNIDSRINGAYASAEFYLLRNGSNYSAPSGIQVKGKVGIEILAVDKMDLSRFTCGINHIEMFADSEKVFSQKINSISFEDYDDIVMLMNYHELKTRGLRFNKLYIDDGNPFNYYETAKNRGEISVNDKPVNVVVNLKDTYGNESHLKINFIPDKVEHPLMPKPMMQPFEYEVKGNVLALRTQGCNAKSKITVFEKGASVLKEPSQEGNGQQLFLIDLQKTIPDSVQTCQSMIRFDIADKIPSNIEYTFYSDWADIHFSPHSLYDTLFMNFSNKIQEGTELFSIGKTTIPLKETIDIKLKPEHQKPNSKVAAYHKENKHNKFIGGQWVNGNFEFIAEELGDFVLLKDTIAPGIRRIYCNGYGARFRISDNLSGIDHFEATINGEWLLMKYDYKTGIIQSEKLDNSIPLKGNFELKIVDRMNNVTIYKQKIL
ncbi:MAG TPA: hypothetical protein DGG95_03970, partial [Cytophagales bacterium]|nr:hypothetical protein [Cytophagales bacterium]